MRRDLALGALCKVDRLEGGARSLPGSVGGARRLELSAGRSLVPWAGPGGWRALQCGVRPPARLERLGTAVSALWGGAWSIEFPQGRDLSVGALPVRTGPDCAHCRAGFSL